MSSPDAAQLIDFFSSMQFGSYIGLVPIVFLLYDSVLTFGREVRLFWNGTLTGASVLFFAIRYSTLLYEVLDIVEYVPTLSDTVRSSFAEPSLHMLIPAADSCNLLAKAFNAINFLRFVPIALFSAMRAYALSTKWSLSTAIFLLSLSPFVVNFIQYGQGLRGAMLPIGNCEAQINVTPVETIMSVLPAVSRGGLIVADLLLILMTWRTLARSSARPRFSFENAHTSLAAIMLWNGTIYFIVMFLLNVLHMTFTLTSIFGVGRSLIAVFTDPLTTILISRFLLDLQNANQQDVQLGTDDRDLPDASSSQGSLTFARALGSINSTIIPGATRDSDMLDEC